MYPFPSDTPRTYHSPTRQCQLPRLPDEVVTEALLQGQHYKSRVDVAHPSSAPHGRRFDRETTATPGHKQLEIDVLV